MCVYVRACAAAEKKPVMSFIPAHPTPPLPLFLFTCHIFFFSPPMQKLNAVLPNDWLHYLGNHRIFDVSHADLQTTQQLLNGSDPYDSFARQYQTRVMLLRGSDLIVAVGSEIRMLNISNVKDAWINVAPTFIDTGKDAQEDQSWLLQVPYKVKIHHDYPTPIDIR